MLAGCDSSASDLQYLRQQEQEQIWHPEKLKLQRELLPDALGSRVVALGTGLAGCQQLLAKRRSSRTEEASEGEPGDQGAIEARRSAKSSRCEARPIWRRSFKL